MIVKVCVSPTLNSEEPKLELEPDYRSNGSGYRIALNFIGAISSFRSRLPESINSKDKDRCPT
jgi:hypothetical protein